MVAGGRQLVLGWASRRAKVGCMVVEEQIPDEALQMLHLLGDYAVGGPHITPGTESFQHLKVKRQALKTPSDWATFEAIHINAAARSLQAAYETLGMERPSSATLYDRVLLMDFDVYDKSGQAKGVVITPQEVLARLKAEGVPLPYCYSYSGTPGNFHMLWIFRVPVIRQRTMHLLRGLYSYWGADPAYTNSTMRNPIYRCVNPNSAGEGTHWWTEWSETTPLIDRATDLAPHHLTLPLEGDTSAKASKLSRNSEKKATLAPSSKFKSRLTDQALEDLMNGAVDGEGRWYLLRSWVIRHINKYFKLSGKPLPASAVQEVISEGNAKFGEPVGPHRVKELTTYWTAKQQWHYVLRQRRAGEHNDYARASHQAALTRYFEIIDMRDSLEKTLSDSAYKLPPHLQELDKLYDGNRVGRNGKITHTYVAWMLGIEERDVIDKDTGEILSTVSPQNQVKNILASGRRGKYTRAEYEELKSSAPSQELIPEGELTSPDKVGTMITGLLESADLPRPVPEHPPKGLLYVC